MDTFSRGSFGRFTLHRNECIDSESYSYLYLEREREREREKKLVFKLIPQYH